VSHNWYQPVNALLHGAAALGVMTVLVTAVIVCTAAIVVLRAEITSFEHRL
jgi:hypothetical protein